MRELVNWKDHVVEFPNRFTKDEAGGYLTLERGQEPSDSRARRRVPPILT